MSASGDKCNATGPNSAAWFNWGGCSNVKDYNVSKGEAIILKVWTDKYSCQTPKFNILDLVGNSWVKYGNEKAGTCEDLADRHERYFCYYNLALQYQDINICENISDDDRLNEPVMKRGCIYSIAVRERNETMCGLMNDSPMKSSCYQSVALAKNDSYICRLIDDQRYLERDSCYRIIAYSKKDRSLCDMITADKERSDCYTGVGSLEQADSSAGDGRPYSIELGGGATGDNWNVTYFPASDRIKIVSRFCFQLDVLRQTGEEVDPYDADVSTCKGPDGKIYNTTGKGSASWFYYSGCASEKYYNVKRGEELTLRVRTDIFCTSPTFNIYEDLGGRWIKYLNKTTSKAAGKSEQGAVKIFQIDGTDGSDGAVEHIKISAKLDLQLESIPFEEILITLDTSNTTQSMGYSASSSVGGRYDVFYFQEGPHYKEGYLSQGDMVAINFSSARPIRTDETVRIRVIPKHGIISSVDILCPEFMTRERIVLYAKEAVL